MIVEFIGCSGAGKTSLAEGLRRRIQPSGHPILSVDLVRERPGLRWMRDPSTINLAADVISFPSFIRAYRRDGDFVRFAFDRLRRHAPTTFAKYNYGLNIVRKVGVHELARRASKRRTVLIDEGVVLSAYQLFVYSDAPYADVDLDRFARLVPMPDRIVYVKAPLDLLVERAIRRPDPRRELAGRKRHEVADRLARAVELFRASRRGRRSVNDSSPSRSETTRAKDSRRRYDRSPLVSMKAPIQPALQRCRLPPGIPRRSPPSRAVLRCRGCTSDRSRDST